MEYQCANCLLVNTGCRLHCVDCRNIDLCVKCFSMGMEMASHKAYHTCQVIGVIDGELKVFSGITGWNTSNLFRFLNEAEANRLSEPTKTKPAESPPQTFSNDFEEDVIMIGTPSPEFNFDNEIGENIETIQACEDIANSNSIAFKTVSTEVNGHQIRSNQVCPFEDPNCCLNWLESKETMPMPSSKWNVDESNRSRNECNQEKISSNETPEKDMTLYTKHLIEILEILIADKKPTLSTQELELQKDISKSQEITFNDEFENFANGIRSPSKFLQVSPTSEISEAPLNLWKNIPKPTMENLINSISTPSENDIIMQLNVQSPDVFAVEPTVIWEDELYLMDGTQHNASLDQIHSREETSNDIEVVLSSSPESCILMETCPSVEIKIASEELPKKKTYSKSMLTSIRETQPDHYNPNVVMNQNYNDSQIVSSEIYSQIQKIDSVYTKQALTIKEIGKENVKQTFKQNSKKNIRLFCNDFLHNANYCESFQLWPCFKKKLFADDLPTILPNTPPKTESIELKRHSKGNVQSKTSHRRDPRKSGLYEKRSLKETNRTNK